MCPPWNKDGLGVKDDVVSNTMIAVCEKAENMREDCLTMRMLIKLVEKGLHKENCVGVHLRCQEGRQGAEGG